MNYRYMQDKIVEELETLKYKETMLEGDIIMLFDRWAHEFNLLNEDRTLALDELYSKLYNKKS